MKFSWKGYFEPTPKSIRKVADSILAGATMAATYSIVTEHEKIAATIMIVSVVAKVISNFFTTEEQ